MTLEPLEPLRLVLLVNEEAHVRELARVATLVTGLPGLRPLVLIEDRMKHLRHPEAFAGVEVVHAAEVERLDVPADPALLGVDPGPRGRRADRVIAWARAAAARLPNRWFRVADFLYYITLHRDLMLRRATLAHVFLTGHRVRALVLCEDNVELDSAVWIAVAHRLGIPVVIVPYTISNTAEFAESYVLYPPNQLDANAGNRLAGWLFPDWVLPWKGRRLLRVPYGKVFAVESLGLAPPVPWLLNSGQADAIAVESPAMQDYYRAAGLPPGQLVVTGSLTDDVLARVRANRTRLRGELLAALGCPDDRPLLLAALPPDQNTYDRPGCEFTGFDDLIGFWGSCLAAQTGWRVIVRPHPKTAPDRIAALIERGLLVSFADTASLVPLADLYVACVSATIRWAIASAVPVINFDVYRYGYRDYEGVTGVRLVESRAAFQAALAELCGDPAALAALAAAQALSAPHWGLLDGGSGARLLALLQDIQVTAP